MKIIRPVSILVLVAMLALPTPASTKSDPLKSIRPLQALVTDEVGESHLLDICTAWSTVYDQKQVWVTAMHCVTAQEEGTSFLIDQKEANLFGGSVADDIAIFAGGPHASPFGISIANEVTPMSEIWVAGYPLGEGQVALRGYVASRMTNVSHLTFYQLPGAQGMSGSPVLSKDNMVVGILQSMNCPYMVQYCPLSSGVPLSTLQRVLGR